MNIREVVGVRTHKELESKLTTMIFDKESRLKFYDSLKDADLTQDIFKDYFEEYSAERKSNKQDYTPKEVAELLAFFSQSDNETTVYDGASGTGALLIAKWNELGNNAEYIATEYADNVIPYLIHNLAIRNMKATVNYGDTLTQEIQKVYTLTPTEEGYSEIQIEGLSQD